MTHRKYLGTLAAGAAFGTVAVGLAACGGSTTQNDKQATDSARQPVDALVQTEPRVQWGYLSILPRDVIKLEQTENARPKLGQQYIKVPFVNINGIELTEGKIVGFQLIRIGCPSIFVIAHNIIDHHHQEDGISDQWLLDRNKKMDELLDAMGYKPTDWIEHNNKPCPIPPNDWSE
jgi:hypothetical protein